MYAYSLSYKNYDAPHRTLEHVAITIHSGTRDPLLAQLGKHSPRVREVRGSSPRLAKDFFT